MRTRTPLMLAGAFVLAAVLLGGAGMALAWGQDGGGGGSGGGSGGMPWSGTPHPMMRPAGHGSMMGPNGHGSMMGGQTGAGTSAGTQATPAVGGTQVQIVNYVYTPTNIQVTAGTTVTWTNEDTVPHTITFTNGMKGSGVLQKGQRFSYTFTTPGTFHYDCAVHPYMIATVTVTA